MKKSKYTQLEEILNAPYRVSKIKKPSKIAKSIYELLHYGETNTGASGYAYGHRLWSVWTSEIADILDSLNIPYEKGNKAPKGGANGEYIRITMPAFLKVVRKLIAEEKRRVLAERNRVLSERKQREEELKKHNKELENARQFCTRHPELREEREAYVDKHSEGTHGNKRRQKRKSAKKRFVENVISRFPNENLSLSSLLSVL